MKAYISHYIAGRTEEEVRNAEAEGVAYALAHLGVHARDVVLPRQIDPWCAESSSEGLFRECPPGRQLPGDAHTVSCYLRADFLELLKCDYIVMTPGWALSVGCLAELNLAVQVGIAVRFV